MHIVIFFKGKTSREVSCPSSPTFPQLFFPSNKLMHLTYFCPHNFFLPYLSPPHFQNSGGRGETVICLVIFCSLTFHQAAFCSLFLVYIIFFCSCYCSGYSAGFSNKKFLSEGKRVKNDQNFLLGERGEWVTKLR